MRIDFEEFRTDEINPYLSPFKEDLSLKEDFNQEEGVVYDKMENRVIAGYLDTLISLLADGKRGDNTYIKIFLLTHHDFIETGHLLLKLIQRFESKIFNKRNLTS